MTQKRCCSTTSEVAKVNQIHTRVLEAAVTAVKLRFDATVLEISSISPENIQSKKKKKVIAGSRVTFQRLGHTQLRQRRGLLVPAIHVSTKCSK